MGKLGEVAAIHMGQSPPSFTYNLERRGLPFLQGKAEFGDVQPTPIKWCSAPQRVAPKGSVLISVRAPVGDVNIAPFECCIGRGLAALEPIDVDGEFLYFNLLMAKWRLEALGTGTTFKSINKAALKDFDLLLPPLLVQRAIAGVLSTLRRAIEATECVIEATLDFRKSLRRYLLTYGPELITRRDLVTTKATAVGPVPDAWEVARLGDVVRADGGLKRGPWGGSIRKDMFVPSGYKVYEQQCVINGDFSLGHYYVDEKKFAELKDFAVEEGDILITAAGTIGKVAQVPVGAAKGIFNQALIRVRLMRDRCISDYFIPLFNDYTERGVLQQSSHGAVLKNLSSVALLRNIPVPLPTIKDQETIAEILSAVDEKTRVETSMRIALLGLFEALLRDLMTGVLRTSAMINEND